jgi:hypothetical protein
LISSSRISANEIIKVLHPYYKLAYIKLAWGGPEEQAAEIAAGNRNAKDWQDEAKQIVERTVGCIQWQTAIYLLMHHWQMAQYYKSRPSASSPDISTADATPREAPVLSDFDKHRETLLSDDAEEGWASELRRYLSTMQRDVKKDTDHVEWWQVSSIRVLNCDVYLLKLVEP